MVNKIAKYILNCLLGLLCCIPVVTIAASVTAMHFVNFKILDDPETNVIKEFFKSFKQNLVQSFAFLIILGVIAGVFAYLWVGMITSEGEKSFIIMGFLFILTIIYFNFECLSTYFLAKFVNTTKKIMLLAFYAGSKNLDSMIKCSLLEIAMIALPIAVYAVNPQAVSLCIGILLFFVLMVIFEMVSARVVNPIMAGLIEREAKARAEREASNQDSKMEEDLEKSKSLEEVGTQE